MKNLKAFIICNIIFTSVGFAGDEPLKCEQVFECVAQPEGIYNTGAYELIPSETKIFTALGGYRCDYSYRLKMKALFPGGKTCTSPDIIDAYNNNPELVSCMKVAFHESLSPSYVPDIVVEGDPAEWRFKRDDVRQGNLPTYINEENCRSVAHHSGEKAPVLVCEYNCKDNGVSTGGVGKNLGEGR